MLDFKIIRFQHLRTFFLVHLCLLIPMITLLAQNNYEFEQYTIREGLSHNSVQCILQDQQGFLWFGTEDGLNRYDGYGFKIFRPTEDSNSISGIFIWDIAQDRNGNIWIGTNNGGLSKYNPQLDKFTNYQHSSTDCKSLRSNYVRSVLVDKDDNVWVGTYGGGLNLLDKTTNKFTCFLMDTAKAGSLANNVIASLYQDSKDRIWVGTEGGLHLFNPSDSTFTLYAHDFDDVYSLSHNQIDAVLEDTTGTLWIGTKNGLNKFDETKQRFIRIMANESIDNALSHNLITSLYIDRTGLIWIGTDGGGITKFNPYTSNFEKIMHQSENPSSLSINLVRKVFEDDLGIVWVATNGGGINKLNPSLKKFNHIKYESHNTAGLNHNVIRSFYKDHHNRLWIGTVGGGINILNPTTGSYSKIIHNVKDSATISANVVISLFLKDKTTLWAGTWEAGVNRITFSEDIPADENPEQYIESIEQFWHEPTNPNSISSDIVQSIFEDSNGFLWFGTGSGLDVYDPYIDGFINISMVEGDSLTLSDNRVQSAIIQDRYGDLWVGTWNGLNRMHYPAELKKGATLTNFKPENVVFNRILNAPGKSNTLSDNRVISLCEDRNSENLTIWAGTYGGGLNKIEVFIAGSGEYQYTFTNYTEHDGLSSNVIYGIQIDDHGNLWMSTNNGISMFDPDKEVFRNYNESEGVQSSQFYWGSGLTDNRGNIYFGGVNGYNVFHPDSIQSMSMAPHVLITDIQIFNESVGVGEIINGRTLLSKSVNYSKRIELSYLDNVISFEFAALHFLAPHMNNHAYMLEGIDKDWVYIGNRRHVTYTNLPPGEYNFLVKGSNNENEWSSEIASLKLIISPPFWQTLIFRVITIFALITLIFLFYRVRMHRINVRNRILEVKVRRKTNDLHREIEYRKKVEDTLRESEGKLKELNASKDKFFKIIAHDLRNPVNVSLGFSELLSKNYKSFDDAKKEKFINSIYQATSNINNLLENLLQWSLSQTDRIKISPSEQDIDDVLKTNLLLLEENIESKEISVELRSTAEQKVLVDPDMLETIVRNILTNAIKFTPKRGNIYIQTRDISDTHVEVMFKDSGVGMSAEQIDGLFKIQEAGSTTGTDGEKGTGLGLLLCHEFIEKNKGEIWAESEENKGASIFIKLPAAH